MKRWLYCAILMLSTSVFAGSERAELAWEMINDGAVVIDVRTPEELKSGYILNAYNIPVQVMDRADLTFIDKNQKIVLYCRSGNRSGRAHMILSELGYLNVHNGGGYQEMMEAKN